MFEYKRFWEAQSLNLHFICVAKLSHCKSSCGLQKSLKYFWCFKLVSLFWFLHYMLQGLSITKAPCSGVAPCCAQGPRATRNPMQGFCMQSKLKAPALCSPSTPDCPHFTAALPRLLATHPNLRCLSYKQGELMYLCSKEILIERLKTDNTARERV